MLAETFKEQNSVLFKNMLDGFFKAIDVNNPTGPSDLTVDLFITPTCNQNCTYCYVQKHKDHLYPQEINNKDTILKNLRLFFDYCLEKNYSFKRIDLFSGEIHGYPFGNAVYDIILEYLEKGLIIQFISVPTNASFCFSKDLIAIINEYIYRFSRHGCRLSFSISYDGPLLDHINRPLSQNGVDKDNDYLNNLVEFVKGNKLGFHPMIDPSTIELQYANYDSWLELLQKHLVNENPIGTYGQIMLLETRESSWTEDKIIEFLKWVKYITYKDIDFFFRGDIDKFFRCNVRLEDLSDIYTDYFKMHKYKWGGYTPYRVGPSGDSIGCIYGSSICVRLGDLAIGPCHRTFYPKFQFGKFVLNEDQTKIVDIECDNYSLASATLITGMKTKPFCSDCSINDICLKYCLGANYENSQELFYPVPENCTLQKAKTVFLYFLYRHLGCPRHPYIDPAYEKLKTQEPEVEQKWRAISQSIIYSN